MKVIINSNEEKPAKKIEIVKKAVKKRKRLSKKEINQIKRASTLGLSIIVIGIFSVMAIVQARDPQ